MKTTISNGSVAHTGELDQMQKEMKAATSQLRQLKKQAAKDAVIWQRYEESVKRDPSNSILRRLFKALHVPLF